MNDVDLDFDRFERIGIHEVVYGQHKSAAQLSDVAARLEKRGANLLVTRCSPEQVAGLAGDYDPVSRTFLCIRQEPVMVVSQGYWRSHFDDAIARYPSPDSDDHDNPVVAGRLRRHDCSQITDGAAAGILVSESFAADCRAADSTSTRAVISGTVAIR